MKKILKEIQDGTYAKAWVEENRSGREWFEGRRREGRDSQLERVGRELRARMPFLDPIDVADKTSAS
jgi:ketol-acid reductoisomerase